MTNEQIKSTLEAIKENIEKTDLETVTFNLDLAIFLVTEFHARLNTERERIFA